MRRSSLLLLTLVALLLGACVDMSRGIESYERGDFEDAHTSFHLLDAPGNDDVTPEFVYDHALSAFGVGELDHAEEILRRLESAEDEDVVALAAFLRGNVLHAKAMRAAEQARGVEAEPFAYRLAIRQAEDAALAWCRAAGLRDDPWPEAARNVERARRLVEQLQKEQRDAEANRERRTAGAGKPRIRPVPVDTSQAGKDDTSKPGETPPTPAPDGPPEQGAASGVTEGDLTPAEVGGLLERLAAKEREKRTLRAETQRASGASGGKDW